MVTLAGSLSQVHTQVSGGAMRHQGFASQESRGKEEVGRSDELAR